jgi:GTP-binding protein
MVTKKSGKASAGKPTRQTAKSTRQTAKSTRQTAKSTRQTAKSTRQAAKSTRQTAKSTRQTTKSTRQTAKSTRQGSAFIASVAAPADLPEGAPEIAFVGRSNVGKSSLLNALAGRKALARTSKTPGRTQRANIFDLRVGGQDVRLVDLPGYGHANAPRHVRDTFGPLIEGWLMKSDRLALATVLIDCRRDATEQMLNFLVWLRQHSIPTAVVFTKVDKIAKNRRLQQLNKIASYYDIGRDFHVTSCADGLGIPELARYIGHTAREFKETVG